MNLVKSQILIRTSAWRVFESIANPAEKIKWSTGMIDSTFCFNEAKALNEQPIVFREIIKTNGSFYAQPVQLVSFKQDNQIELKYAHKNYSLDKNYVVKAIGNYTILELTFKVYYGGKRLQKILAWLLGYNSLKRNVENELMAIKNMLDYDFVQVLN